MSPAQRAEVALHPATLLCRLGQVEVAGVLQVRTLVEVSLEGTAQKAHVVLLKLRFVAFLDEPVLFVWSSSGSRAIYSVLSTGNTVRIAQSTSVSSSIVKEMVLGEFPILGLDEQLLVQEAQSAGEHAALANG